MFLDLESGRRQKGHVPRTAFDVERAMAFPANEMMVMNLPGYLVARRFTRNFDRSQPILIDQKFDVPVDRRDPDRPLLIARDVHHFVWRERSSRLQENVADDPSLNCVAFHEQKSG